jgi:ATP-binding cassette, subfamily C, bacterial
VFIQCWDGSSESYCRKKEINIKDDLRKLTSRNFLRFNNKLKTQYMKYSTTLQHSEEDCGAACLAAIAKHYGQTTAISRIRDAVGTIQKGTTLLGLRHGAETLGFNARCVQISPDILHQLNKIPLPAIIHWRGKHWVVLHGRKRRKFVVADPAVGVRYLSKRELMEGWLDGVTLLVEPDLNRQLSSVNLSKKRFLSFFKRTWVYRSQIFPVLLINLILGMLSLASPFLMQILTDDVLVRGDLKLLTTLSLAVIVMTLISSSLGFIQSNLVINFAQRMHLNLTLEFGKKILHLPLLYYESRRSGEIVSRLQDIHQINQLIAQIIISLPSQFFIASISLLFMIFYSWKLSIAAIIFALTMLISTVLFMPILQQKTRAALIADADNQGVLVEVFKGALTIKTTMATPQFWQELQTRFGHLAKLSLNTAQIGVANQTFAGLISNIGSIILIWFGGTLVSNPIENLSIGQLLAFKAMTDNFLGFINSSVAFADEITRVTSSVERLSEVINADSENADGYQKPIVSFSPKDDIIYDQINFHYPGKVELLENFSITIPGGHSIALIGQSGCGKSTLAKLLTGLYMPQNGNLKIGKFNLQDLSLDCIRQQVILVPQEAHFWSRTILENFQMSNPTAKFENIVQACKVVDADDFISQLPNKYQTVLGEYGTNLSGGQRQRLAIARAIVGDPPILILDESTAGLDPVSEGNLLDQLLEHRQGKTTILISHRPRVIRRADCIIYLSHGSATMKGSFDELFTRPGEHLNLLIP